ncbi:Phosphatidate cytidylyltransferase [Ralstonia mannitolilytica]|uniref:phosphatidate cytidylyltransferase n=1 Tax=Ralstonia mannitolilytica TaxID=105219 RepID=UPI0028F5BFF3|nr:phosphatidate cytidylyltransferase [Ralstonia mannitolilytica]CAJ0800336.1 Phosphatidate cytidylyltransferase [Ralstonia mannitolilytica]
MLLTRVVTAVCLLIVILPILFFAPPAGLVGLVTVFAALAAWEWGRLVRLPGGWGPVLYAVVVVLLTIAWYDIPPRGDVRLLFYADVVAWLVAWMLLAGGIRTLQGGRQLVFALLGMVILPAFVHAVSTLRAEGIAFLLSVAVLVWAADVGAYFVGKAVGRRKLAPSISPGKSWEGAIGGAALVALIAAVAGLTHWFAPTWFSYEFDRHGALVALVLTLLLVAASIGGDLFESLLKRQVGMKDSSRLLPGHGGVLDRIDALLPVFPLAALLIS